MIVVSLLQPDVICQVYPSLLQQLATSKLEDDPGRMQASEVNSVNIQIIHYTPVILIYLQYKGCNSISQAR